MGSKIFILLIAIGFLSCQYDIDNIQFQYAVDDVPSTIPLEFTKCKIPTNRIVHKGIFNPDITKFYYSVSSSDFSKFDVYVIKKIDGNWTDPQKAFFNTKYSEHGMSFSPDGNTIYFSSTRPTKTKDDSPTWHIWKSVRISGKWNEPVFIDIPNMKDKLLSHPIITESGTLYFHASNLDYSNMDIYHSQFINGEFEDAQKIEIPIKAEVGRCTPYVSPKEEYLIFADIGSQLDLMISFNNGKGKWLSPVLLNDRINNMGQGNPHVTPDNKFLFYTKGEHLKSNWEINWVNIESVLKNNQFKY